MYRVILLLLLMLVARETTAGKNAAGKASLSWDPQGVATQMAQPPSSTFPLFLHLSDTPNIRSLAVELRWSTGDSSGCYTVVSSAPDVACGWATDTPPGGNFLGDNTYTWSITFLGGSAKSCVVYTVSSLACGPTTPVTFWLASVLAKDATGAVDSLSILDQATIGSSSPFPAEPTYVPNQIIVWFKPNVVSLPAGETSASLTATSFAPEAVRSEILAVGGTEIRMLTPTATVENLVAIDPDSNVIVLDTRQLDMYVVELADTNVVGAVQALRADAVNVLAAHPDWIRTTLVTPNDPLFGQQWWARNTGQFNGLAGEDLGATSAWDSTTGTTQQVNVVVLDTGSDPSHPELAGRVINGPNYITAGPPLDDSPSSHGTSVSGIIAAMGNNAAGVAGLNWGARIIAVKVCDALEGCPTSDVDAGLDWARVSGYKLVNMSLSGVDNP
ncbi:MAG: S8 family serine peptidase, partial [bacterium]